MTQTPSDSPQPTDLQGAPSDPDLIAKAEAQSVRATEPGKGQPSARELIEDAPHAAGGGAQGNQGFDG